MSIFEMIRKVQNLKNGDGFTMKNRELINYKTGYQLADYGHEYDNVFDVIQCIIAMNYNVGVWYENGIYYVDHSFRVNTKKQAISDGKKYNQISVYDWKHAKVVYIEY